MPYEKLIYWLLYRTSLQMDCNSGSLLLTLASYLVHWGEFWIIAMAGPHPDQLNGISGGRPGCQQLLKSTLQAILGHRQDLDNQEDNKAKKPLVEMNNILNTTERCSHKPGGEKDTKEKKKVKEEREKIKTMTLGRLQKNRTVTSWGSCQLNLSMNLKNLMKTIALLKKKKTHFPSPSIPYL